MKWSETEFRVGVERLFTCLSTGVSLYWHIETCLTCYHLQCIDRVGAVKQEFMLAPKTLWSANRTVDRSSWDVNKRVDSQRATSHFPFFLFAVSCVIWEWLEGRKCDWYRGLSYKFYTEPDETGLWSHLGRFISINCGLTISQEIFKSSWALFVIFFIFFPV